MTNQTTPEIIDLRGAKLLSLPNVAKKVGLGRSSIYRYIKAGKFPAPVHIGESTTRWIESELDAWIEMLPRKKASDA